MKEPVSAEQRKYVLDEQIAIYARKGYRMVSQSGTMAQMIKPKKFSFFWALMWFLMLGVGLVVYLIYYAAKQDEAVFIEVNEFGEVKIGKR